MEGKLGEHHSGELHLEAAGAKGERIVVEELARLGENPITVSYRGQI
jgi:hypothetical protein